MSLPQGTLLQGGKYLIKRFISSGGFGCTYKARQTSTGKLVAIKELFVKELSDRDEQTLVINAYSSSKSVQLAKAQKKFVEEAKVLMSMSHPNIVSVYDQFEENGTAYYVMDYIEGRSLHEIVKADGPLPVDKALRYLYQICDALSYVHVRNRLHLDIKPSNIMIDESDNAILIDFGLSKLYDDEPGDQQSSILGQTPAYSPIELFSKKAVQLSPATDIYALGATFYKCLSGNTPPDAATIVDEGIPPLPHTVPAHVRTAIEHAMAVGKGDRPQSIAEFKKELEEPTDSDESTSNTVNFLVNFLVIAFLIAMGIHFLALGIRGCTSNNNSVSEEPYVTHADTSREDTSSYEIPTRDTISTSSTYPTFEESQPVTQTAELSSIMDKFNSIVRVGGNTWDVLDNFEGLQIQNANASDEHYSYAAEYKGVVYMDGKTISNSARVPKFWHIRLLGARAGVAYIELSPNLIGFFEDDVAAYLRRAGCSYLRGRQGNFSWYKVYRYKSIYVALAGGGSGNAGNPVTCYIISSQFALDNVEDILDEGLY